MSPKTIVIIGGGIAGTCTAYFTAISPHRQGTKIIIVEGTKIAAAASGYSGGFLAKDWHGSATSSLAAKSFDLHASLAKEYDGSVNWGYRTVETLSVEYDATRPTISPSPLPWLPQGHLHSSRILGTHSTTAQVHPGQFTNFISRQFLKQSNTELVIGRASGLKIQDGKVKGVEVKTENGVEMLEADCVVLCAGPWTGSLAVELLGKVVGKKLGVTGHRAHSVVLKTKERLTPHCLFTSMTMEDGSVDEPEVYTRPDGELLTPVSCGAGDDEPLPPTASDIHPSPIAIAKLHRQAATLTPHFSRGEGAEVLAEQCCYLPIADRGRPLIGKVSGVEGVYVGSGLSCWGITQGPGTGLVLSELILEGKVKSADISKLAP
ncbi:cytoplasmic protein [Tremella mesenterica]|uniref:Cytoplasmic protein n=1 Tax=Tremella mesenterica TaxID=5217 RepID=A0A4Q1BGZ9_TREME|nr:uncharacterized protein TREMEDRAFT_30802 [Tremella mesenterica DSM 1558]EIW69367.1 hypothetical protein TREMEDRAFT_30802 [Tremella mesenterica DSM 1558]RXK36855.1 cytoplasmic protein [Tremella mesenterica]